MKIIPSIQRTARRHGGLSIGLRIHFPCHIVDTTSADLWETHYDCITVLIGLIFWQIDIDLNYNYRQINFYEEPELN